MKLYIYVVRHGQTYSNVHGILQGHEDSPLTPIGRHCSTQTGNALRHVKFHKVCHLQRKVYHCEHAILKLNNYVFFDLANYNLTVKNNASDI